MPPPRTRTFIVRPGRAGGTGRPGVRREGADPPVSALAEAGPAALEARHHLTHRGAEVVREPRVRLVVVVGVAVGIGHRHRPQLDGDRAALETGAIHPLVAVLE